MSTKTAASDTMERDEQYDQFERQIRERVAALEGPLFTTNAASALWAAYLGGLPDDRRQHYTCHCCRRFIETYGGLVTIDSHGEASPAIWHDALLGAVPDFFSESVVLLRASLNVARIDGVFLSSDKIWGQPLSGGW